MSAVLFFITPTRALSRFSVSVSVFVFAFPFLFLFLFVLVFGLVFFLTFLTFIT